MRVRVSAIGLLVAMFVAVATDAGAFATIEGVVQLPSAATAPAPKPRYPIATTYVVGPPDPPAAVVYVEGANAAAGQPTAPVEVAQHAYQFAPGLIAVQRGTVVRFPNVDDEYHSVFSYSKPKRFDLGR